MSAHFSNYTSLNQMNQLYEFSIDGIQIKDGLYTRYLLEFQFVDSLTIYPFSFCNLIELSSSMVLHSIGEL
jgi:hypothetical protein